MQVHQSEISTLALRGVLPDSINTKIKEEQATKKEAFRSMIDLNNPDNRDTANHVCQEFDIKIRDDYTDFFDQVNNAVKTNRETAMLFNILNGNPLGLSFLDKLNYSTLGDKEVRGAFISWTDKLTGTIAGNESIDECICMAYNAILEDKRIHPDKEWSQAFELINLNDKNHSAKVFATYKHIWDTLRQTTLETNFFDKLLEWINKPRNVSEAQLGQLHTGLLQCIKNSMYTLTDEKIIEPMIRDKSSILAILESYSDRTIGNMEYLRWRQNDHILDEILDYLLSYYHRMIQFISDTSCFDRGDEDTFAIKQLIEHFILLHKKSELRIRALDTIDKKGDLSIYIVDRFLRRQLNDNIRCDPDVLKRERDVKEKALQIYENILRDEQTIFSKRDHIERNLEDCILNINEDSQVRIHAVDIISRTRNIDIAFDRVKGMLVKVMEDQGKAQTIRHCPTCGQTITDRTIQERVLQIYENVINVKSTNHQLKEHIERNMEILILDSTEDVHMRKFVLDIVCRTRSAEKAFNKAKDFLTKVIEYDGRKQATKG